MGLRSTIDKALGAALSAVGDIPKTITYNAITIGAYNPTTGATGTTTATHSVQAVLENYRASEIDGESIKPFDQRALIRQSKLSVTPKLTDTIVIDTVTWNIKNIEQDPAGATWVLQLRMA